MRISRRFPSDARLAARRLARPVRALALPGVLACLALPAVGGAQVQQASNGTVVPMPASVAPSGGGVLSGAPLRIEDRAATGESLGWLESRVAVGNDGVAVTVSRSALRLASPNARVLGVRAVLVDPDTTRGWRVLAASPMLRAGVLQGCVDGRLAQPARFEIPTAGNAGANGGRLAFELVGQVRAPGERKWSRLAERRVAGPVISTAP